MHANGGEEDDQEQVLHWLNNKQKLVHHAVGCFYAMPMPMAIRLEGAGADAGLDGGVSHLALGH